jgi:hypothetical protein
VPDWRGEVQNHIFETVVWESPDSIAGYDFLEGDARFVVAFTAPE